MRLFSYVRICVLLALCLALPNCTEDIPDPLTRDDILASLRPTPRDSETTITDNTSTGTSDPNPDVTDVTIDFSDISIDTDTAENQNSGLPDGYWISETMEPGAWAEYKIYTVSGTRKDRLEYIGTDTYEGRECYLIEYDQDTTLDGGIRQLWIDKLTEKVVLMALEENGEVFVRDFGMIPDPIVSILMVLGHGQESGAKLYVTPTGKTTNATIYEFEDDEIWVSGDIPFRLVKSLEDAQVDLALFNYGDSGAERDITRADIENNLFDEIELPGQAGEIIINIGNGPRPELQFSEPISLLIMLNEDGETIWELQANNDQEAGLPGPLQYGVIPDEALQIVPFDGSVPPDLVAGETYEALVIGELHDEQIPSIGELIFIR